MQVACTVAGSRCNSDTTLTVYGAGWAELEIATLTLIAPDGSRSGVGTPRASRSGQWTADVAFAQSAAGTYSLIAEGDKGGTASGNIVAAAK